MAEPQGRADYLAQFNSANGRVVTSWWEAVWNDAFRTTTNENDPNSWLNRKRREVAANGGPISITVNVKADDEVGGRKAGDAAGASVRSHLEAAGLAVGQPAGATR
jgi:hypothetical protein